MPRVSKIALSPPYPVEKALSRLANNIRTARLRRNLTIEELAERVGTSRQAMGEIEKGKPTSEADQLPRVRRRASPLR